jgi:L-rhamnose mutarotase
MVAANAKVQEWEALMAKFQEVSADKPGFEKWRRMERVFYLPKAKPPVAP